MSELDLNVYYRPENFNLTTVGEIHLTDESYEFDRIAVWCDAAGTLYWAADSGCSCPIPFEGITGVHELSTGTFHELQTFVEAEIEARSHRGIRDFAIGQFIDLAVRARAVSSPTAVSDMVDDGTLTVDEASTIIITAATR